MASIIRNGQKYHVPNEQTFNAMGLDWNAVRVVSAGALANIPTAAPQ